MVEDGAQQVGSPWAGIVTAAQTLAIDGHRYPRAQLLPRHPLADVRIQPISIEPLQDAANRRFRRRGPAFRAEPLERLAGESLRPFANGTETPRSRQRSAHRDAHNGDHRMTHPARLARVGKGS